MRPHLTAAFSPHLRHLIMFNFLRSLLLLCAMCVSAVGAHALLQPVPNYTYGAALVNETTPRAEDWRSTLSAACSQALAHSLQVNASTFSSGTVTACTVGSPTAEGIKYLLTLTPANGGGTLERFSPVYQQGDGTSACPANSTPVTGGCQCNTGYDESGGQCVPHVNVCTAKTGVVGVTNWTQGYSRTPDEGDVYGVGPVYPPPAGGNVCDGGCLVSLQTSGPGVSFYVSQTPTPNGLYRRSVDYPNIGLGTECTAGAADAGAQKTTAAPPCPGTVGEVNGKTVCVGTAAQPVTTAPIDRPSVPPVAGNPAAGAKPASGEGAGTGSTGRTPSAGNGTATGGPAGAAVGGKGGGAGGTASSTAGGTGEGETPDPCGAPGQPMCNVKVDETGTAANAGTTFDAAKESVENSGNQTIEKINQARDRTDGPAWSFTFALPTGCSPYPVGFGEVVLNVCQYQGTIHDLLSMVWAAVTAFTIIGMVGRTIRGT